MNTMIKITNDDENYSDYYKIRGLNNLGETVIEIDMFQHIFTKFKDDEVIDGKSIVGSVHKKISQRQKVSVKFLEEYLPWVKYNPNILQEDNQDRYYIIRGSTHDSTLIFSIMDVGATLRPLLERSTCHKSQEGLKVSDVKYEIGDLYLESSCFNEGRLRMSTMAIIPIISNIHS